MSVGRRVTCIWEKLEKFNSEPYPECVKSILLAAGYNTRTALSQINKEKLEQIEAFVKSEHIEHLNTESMDGVFHEYYNQLEVFKFLPGHEAIILSIPGQIEKMLSKKQSNRSQVKRQKKEAKQTRSDEELVANLLQNVKSYTEKIGFDHAKELITISNITEFEKGSAESNFIAKCRFICPFCAKTFPVKYKEYWLSSNITTHLKTHYQNRNVRVNEE